MKHKFTLPTIAALLLTSAVAVYANTSVAIPDQAQSVAKQLEDEGWKIVEVEIEDDEVELEAIKGNMEREVVISLATGEILEDEQEKDDD